MNITVEMLEQISEKYGESFYLVDSKQFIKNYDELQKSFRDIYSNSHIAYSYKTNYTPKFCKIVNQKGGFAEVVSDMECNIALKVGVKAKNIIFNGPYKNSEAIESLLINGGTVNIDSDYEFSIVKAIAKKNPETQMSVGIRCNFEINDGVISRFGFDVDDVEFGTMIKSIEAISNLNLSGLHCHFATRSIETWPARAKGMLELVSKYFEKPPKFVSLGGGLYGKMEDSLKAQFSVDIPTYNHYAQAVATQFEEFYQNTDLDDKPMLIIEPGSALVGDSMKFVASLINIKDIRGKKIATLAGSIYNINPTLNKKNPPIEIYNSSNNSNPIKKYENLDFGGYTCIESDYLYRGFEGDLAIGDFIVFGNVGSYSIVLKPPFILPNFAMVDCDFEKREIELIKKRETFDDIFRTFEF